MPYDVIREVEVPQIEYVDKVIDRPVTQIVNVEQEVIVYEDRITVQQKQVRWPRICVIVTEFVVRELWRCQTASA